MNKLEELLRDAALNNGADVNQYSLVAAPEFGGNFKSDGFSIKKKQYLADVGKYSTNNGDNYYGYAGMQPFDIGGMKLGGAAGAYGNQSKLNALLGLLVSGKIGVGEARAMLSPFGETPGLFFGYEKKS